jgi:hypothetical protein
MKTFSIVGLIFSILFLLLSFFLMDIYQGTGNATGVIMLLLSLLGLTVSIIYLVKSFKKKKNI